MSFRKILLEGDTVTPSTHASTHEDGGADKISVAGLSGELADPQPPKAHLLGVHTEDTLVNLNAKVSDATLDDSGDPRDPNVHKIGHEDGGSDEISVLNLSGLLADGQTPLSHAASHKSGQGDEIDLDELGNPTGNVDFAQMQATGLALDVQATPPGTPVEGQIYHSSADGHPYVYVPA